MSPLSAARLILILLPLASSPVLAGSGNKAPVEQPKTPLEELLVESGLERALLEIPRTLYHCVDFAQSRLEDQKFSEAQLKNVADRLNATYTPDLVQATALGHLRESLRARDISQVLNWLRSPSGKIVNQAEARAENDASLLEMDQYIASLVDNPPDKAYVDTINTIMQLQEAYSITARLTAEGDLVSDATISNVRGKFDREAFENQVREQIIRSAMPREDLLAQTRNFFLATYRNVPEKDLQRYISFLRSEAGKRFSYAVISSYMSVMEKGRDSLAAQMSGQEKTAGVPAAFPAAKTDVGKKISTAK